MSEIPGPLYIAIGAVIASIIAGLFSYFNLITSKETKISEFRQDWINELRKDISLYVSSMQSLITFENYINEHLKKNKIKDLDVLKKRAELHDAALVAYNSIHLRINKNEKNNEAKEINNKFILSLETAYQSRKAGETEDLGYLLEQVIKNAEILLKHEWNRVRDGEKAYRYSKNGALFFLLITLMLAFPSVSYYVLDNLQNNAKRSSISTNIRESEKKAL